MSNQTVYACARKRKNGSHLLHAYWIFGGHARLRSKWYKSEFVVRRADLVVFGTQFSVVLETQQLAASVWGAENIDLR